MELSGIRSSVVADAAVSARADDRVQKISVLYSGNADFARVQFATEAPLLHLVMDVEALSPAGAANDRPAIDVAFIDCGAPGINAASLVEELRERQPGLPIVIALDPGVDDAARLALDLQAEDYTVKSPGWLGRLQVRLAMVVARQRRARQLEAVRAIEQRLRSIVESSPVCLARVDRFGTILAINDAARAMIGATQPADVLRKSIVTFVTPDDQEAARRFIDMACSEQAGCFEFSLTTSPAGTRRVEASAIKLPTSANGDATAALVLRETASNAPLDRSVVDAAIAEATGNLSAQAARLAFENEQVQQALAELQERHRQLMQDRDRALAAADRAGAAETMLAGKLHHLEADAVRMQREREELQRVFEENRATQLRDLASTASARDDLVRALKEAEAARRLLEAERDSLQTAAEERRLRYEAEIAGALFARAELEGRLRSVEAGAKRAAEETRLSAAAQLIELEARSRQLQTERDGLREAADASARERQAEIEALAAARTEAQQRVTDLERQLRAAEAGAKLAAEEKMAFATVQRTELEARRDQLEIERAALQQTIEARAREHRAEIAAADEAIAATAARLTELEARGRQLETERDALREAVETRGQEHHAAIAALAVARADAQLRVADLEGRLRAAEASAERAAAETRAATASQLRELEARWQQLEAERDALRQSVEALERDQPAKLAALAAAHTEAQGRISDLEDRLRAAEAGAKRTAEEAAAVTADRLQQLETRCRQVESERDALREAEDTLGCQHRAELADVVAGRAAVERKVAELEARARVALEAQDLSARQLAQWKTGTQQLDGERTRLEAQVEDLERRLMRAVTERDGLRLTLADVHERHAKALADEISNRRALELRVFKAGSRLEHVLETARAEFVQLAACAKDGSEPEAPPWT